MLGRGMAARLVRVLLLLLLPLALLAVAETESPRVRAARLEHAVLAPCCYTESVAVHQSEIALKMRVEIAKWVAAGKSDQEITDTYVGLYGTRVLVDPRTAPRGWMPFFPWIVLILGVFLVVWLLRRWRAVPEPHAAGAASTAEVLNLPNIDDE
jgi:cytochrome c-type biogenesis protein CcmH/NrfF